MLWNAPLVTQPSTESKVMTPWVTELAFADPVITLLPTEDVSSPTAKLTNGAHNVKLTSPCASNAKPTSTESSSSQNTFAFVLMAFMKEPMEHVFLAHQDAPSVHRPLTATLASPKPPTMETEHADALSEPSSESPLTVSDTVNNVFNTAMFAITDLLAKLANKASSSQSTTPASVPRTISSIQEDSAFHARLVVNLASLAPHVKNVLPHSFFKKTIVSKNAALDSTCQVQDVSDVLTTVLDALPPTNASTVETVSSFMEVLATLPAPPVASLTEKASNVFLATAHARLVQTTQAHVPAVRLVKVSSKSLEMTKNVSNNALKELSQKMESVKFVTLDVPNVWVLPPTVSPAQLEDFCSTPLVGTTAQVSSTEKEDVWASAQPDTLDCQIKNASNVQLNARLAATTQLV